MEGFPIPENISSKEDILEQLKTQGLTAENLTLITRWYEAKEKEIKTRRDEVKFEISKIDFYFALNDRDGAFDIAKDAYEIARREGEDDLCDKLLKMFPELDMKLER